MVKCKKCGLDSHELTWDQAFHETSGKWRLFHEGQGRPHECHIQKSQEMIIEDPKPLVKCPKCNPLSNNAWMKRETLQEHLKTEHLGFW
jgi:hypothetical protein|tara:strand:+ start:5049 stop:5315 length:267 start_codon:yes stop_codon:yes gene_type:complete